jgi:hypothetical protein
MKDAAELHYRLAECDFTGENRAELEKQYREKQIFADNIKDITYYRLIMRQLEQKDVSPYGVDLLKA